MKLVSTLLRPWRHQNEPWKPGAPERRADMRYEVYLPVSIAPRGMAAAAAVIRHLTPSCRRRSSVDLTVRARPSVADARLCPATATR